MAPLPYFNDKGEVLPLTELMSLSRLDDWTFESRAKAYEPTGGANGAYGGFIYALSSWAAAQTVKQGLFLHSVSGNFILGGIPKEHFRLDVSKIRDGGSYSTRYVTATQSKGVCFTALVSFKRSEKVSVDVQEKLHISQEYSSVLVGKGPFDHPESPSLGSEWFQTVYMRQHPEHYNPLPGLHLRQVDMSAYNESRKPTERRQLAFYSIRGRIDPDVNPNMHAIAHLFASDRNSLYLIARHLDLSDRMSRTASLSHTVIFHVDVAQMLMHDEPAGRSDKSPPTEPPKGEDWSGRVDETKRKWFVQESWMSRAAGGRGLHQSRLWDPDTGVHIATTIQDGLVRFREGSEARL